MIDKTYMVAAAYIHSYTLFTPNLARVCVCVFYEINSLHVTDVLRGFFV
jgi:hypothetical protein